MWRAISREAKYKIQALFTISFVILTASCDYIDEKLNGYYSESEKNEAPIDSNGVIKNHYTNGALMNEITYVDGIRNGLMTGYFEDGSIRSEVDYKDGEKHGKSKQYYEDGVLNSEIEYVDGEKDGYSKWYYQTGELYEEAPYANDEINGIKKRFTKSGSVLHEIPYKNGNPGKGLKEFNKKGELITDYPKIMVRGIDKLAFENMYVLEFYLDKPAKDVQFFVGDLEDGIYLNEMKLHYIVTEKGIGKTEFFVQPNNFIMQTINLVAMAKSKSGNPLVLTKSYNLAVENKQ